MRSRYSAFVLGDIDWIMASHHPDTVHEIDRASVEEWSSTADWLGLRIRNTEAGGPDDATGIVEFRARYRVNGQQVDHDERASFARAGDSAGASGDDNASRGPWRFHSVAQEMDAPELVPVTPRSEVGRNDPCPCGSGKKYKKCHGAAA